jgi:hypothetical protein
VAVLLISASRVARIIGVSHQLLASPFVFLKQSFKISLFKKILSYPKILFFFPLTFFSFETLSGNKVIGRLCQQWA